MKYYLMLASISLIFSIKADYLTEGPPISIATALDYTNDLTGTNPQATPYLAQSALGSSSNLVATIGSLAPYAPGYHYFNSDYYPPEYN